MVTKIIDRTNVNEPTNREGFWAYKLKSFVPKGWNVSDFLWFNEIINWRFSIYRTFIMSKFCVLIKEQVPETLTIKWGFLKKIL